MWLLLKSAEGPCGFFASDRADTYCRCTSKYSCRPTRNPIYPRLRHSVRNEGDAPSFWFSEKLRVLLDRLRNVAIDLADFLAILEIAKAVVTLDGGSHGLAFVLG